MSVDVVKGRQPQRRAKSLARFAGVLLDDQDARVERVLTDNFWQQPELRRPARVIALVATKTSDRRTPQ